MNKRTIVILSVFLIFLGQILFPKDCTALEARKNFSENITSVKTVDTYIHDAERSADIPILIYMPQKLEKKTPVILYSHGLGGARTGSAYLGRHWAQHGYIAVFMQHIGSDESIWQGKSRLDIITSMKNAANGDNFFSRIKDVRSVIDGLEEWNSDKESPLYKKINLNNIGMSGHSFGAVTTQAVSGQSFSRKNTNVDYTDKRIKAAIAFSPSPSRNGGNPQESFGRVSIPWLLMTGTEDHAIIGNTTPQDRLLVYPALPPGDKYELLLNGAEHSAFTDREFANRKAPRNPNHHKVILTVSTDFWDAYLKNDTSAKNRLSGEEVAKILEQGDRWQTK